MPVMVPDWEDLRRKRAALLLLPDTPGEDESLDTWRQYATVLSSSDGRGIYAIEGMDMLTSICTSKSCDVTWGTSPGNRQPKPG